MDLNSRGSHGTPTNDRPRPVARCRRGGDRPRGRGRPDHRCGGEGNGHHQGRRAVLLRYQGRADRRDLRALGQGLRQPVRSGGGEAADAADAGSRACRGDPAFGRVVQQQGGGADGGADPDARAPGGQQPVVSQPVGRPGPVRTRGAPCAPGVPGGGGRLHVALLPPDGHWPGRVGLDARRRPCVVADGGWRQRRQRLRWRAAGGRLSRRRSARSSGP